MTTDPVSRVTVVPHERLIRFKVTAPADASEIAAFGLELREAVERVRQTAENFDVLADLRDVIVMPQSEIGQGRERLQWMADNGLRKAAHIVGHALTTLQIRRLATDHRFQYFNTEEDARAWLEKK